MENNYQENNEEQIDWMFDENYQNENRLKVNKLKYTDSDTIVKLYKIMRIIDQEFQNSSILYWSAFGTTLGCVRHGGIIPWDDDLDLCMKIEDVEYFENELKPKLLEQRLNVSKVDFGYKIFLQEGSLKINNLNPSLKEEYMYPFCDLFLMKKKGNNYIINDRSCQKTNENEIYSKQQLNNITRKDFGDFQVNIVGDVEQYLQNSYGDNWKTEAKTHFLDHLNQECMEAEVFELTQELLQPAKPFQ